MADTTNIPKVLFIILISVTSVTSTTATASQTTTSKPNATTSQAYTSKPTATTSHASTSKPSATTSQASTSKPTATTSQTSTSKPTATSSQASTSKPTTTKSQAYTSQPTTTTSEASTSQPTTTTSQASTSQPTTASQTTTFQQTTTITGSLGSECITHPHACDNITSAECTDGSCHCSEGFKEYQDKKGECKPFDINYNTSCDGQITAEDQCATPNASCRTESGKCQCIDDHFYLQDSCVEMPMEIKATDLTIPIVAGIASALVVIAAVGVVVFVLRKKQRACFAKDDECLGLHTPGEGVHMDPIEPTKNNTFRPGPIKLSDFPDVVENMHKDGNLLFADAFQLLKEKSPKHPMTAAEQQCCRPKNRYIDILPFDHSRVKLRPSDDMEGSDYINANYIPGYTFRREYIVTQGAMEATFYDFWRMIWEQNVDTIVMLTKLVEKGQRKCDKYWPDLGEPVFYGDLVVSLQSESNLSDYTIKIFEVKMKEERKMVRHFSYLKWPDMGCPDTPELLLEFVKAVRQYTNREMKSTSGPTVVHCSAGVGRTGTFIAVDYLLQHIRDNDEVDIFTFVLEMRNHRRRMVQTEDQYIYIHECLKSFIQTDEEKDDEADDEHVYVNTSIGAQEENIYENSGYQKDRESLK